MADENQLQLLREGPDAWNKWRWKFPDVKVDLSGANLCKASLGNADLHRANLTEAELVGVDLHGANLEQARLVEANLTEANLVGANLTAANLCGAILNKADLGRAHLNHANLTRAQLRGGNLTKATLEAAYFQWADLSGADFRGAHLSGAYFLHTNIEGAIFADCEIFGISAWALQGTPKEQSGLIITPGGEAMVYVDDLQVAQFVYLLLNRENLRSIINTITSKAVLILGRFTQERKVILDVIAQELRQNHLLPIIFDFEKPSSKDFTETIKTLASISLFIIADITNPKLSPLELQATVPDYQIPFVPIIQENEAPFSMLNDLIGKYDWVLQPLTYHSKDDLISGFKPAIIDRAWRKHQELQKRKNRKIETQSIADFLEDS